MTGCEGFAECDRCEIKAQSTAAHQNFNIQENLNRKRLNTHKH
ncbi:hypothetical protein LY39_02282 [Roseinatronobacter bogoriensis subsp. barguzinensis]|nr:hypothetical protein [Rhodobaca bogoriensis DSM 18756]TDW37928.1 hypothetical protein LY39_02282 [Rhodobaca barguzinensis]TDY69902.1 hypothetical protein EV660_103297 [Rhodobaca bogoriensis DSM 18756]